MNITQLYEGIKILIKYNTDGDISAEHDEIFCDGPEPNDLDASDLVVLKVNNWLWDEQFDCWKHFT